MYPFYCSANGLKYHRGKTGCDDSDISSTQTLESFQAPVTGKCRNSKQLGVTVTGKCRNFKHLLIEGVTGKCKNSEHL